jgi:ATP-dependent Clp protease ATP-binding subunit ClpA
MKTAMKLDPTKRGNDAERLERRLQRLIVGQDAAIQGIVDVYQLYLTGMNAPGRPIANFLFLGPTGCGKTRVVEATAECLVNNPRAVVKIDCAEFQHSHEIAKLIGSPPGYLGHRETTALLSQESIDKHHTEDVKVSFVLFDEIEKASDALWNLLLGILDKGVLTLGDNRKVDFSHAMIFMTGNIGSTEMSALLNPRLGFAPAPLAGVDLSAKMARSGVDAARRKFTPEFINRIDKIVVFKPLGKAELRQIVDLEIDALQDRVVQMPGDRAFRFTLTDDAKEFLLDEGTDMRYGARHLKRAIERLVVHPLSSLIATEQVVAGDVVSIGHDAASPAMTFERVERSLPAIAKAA